MLRKYPRFLSRTGVGVCSLVLAGLLVDETRGAIAEFEGVRYHVFRVDPAAQEIRLYWRDAVGNPFKQFRALDQSLRAQGERLLFAMNAGIYEPGWIPAGLHIEQGTELRPLNQQGPPPRPPGKSTPNFYLLPNGVFYLLPDGRAGVRETQAFAAAGLPPPFGRAVGPLAAGRWQDSPGL